MKLTVPILTFILILSGSIVLLPLLYSSPGLLESGGQLARVTFSRAAMFWAILFGLMCILVRYREVKLFFVKYFKESSSPLSLAVFRIVLFLAVLSLFESHDIGPLLLLPESMRVAPPGMGWFLKYLPINTAVTLPATFLFKVLCVLASVGIFTKASTVSATILGFYVLAIPQLFGKVFHYHYLWWFMLLISCSRCGDALSMDALIRYLRGKIKSPLGTLQHSTQYGLPLRWAWVLMGVFYLFAGLWKWFVCGVDWFIGDNMKYILYWKWTEMNDWLPIFRIDQFPLMYQLGAFAAVFWELSFLFLILFPKTRVLALVSGIIFHQMTSYFMNIPFTTLQMCYVSLINWEKVFAFVFRWKKDPAIRFQETPQSLGKIKNSRNLINIFGTILLVGNIVCGITFTDSWPVANPPTFAKLLNGEYYFLEAELVMEDKTTVILDTPDLQEGKHGSIYRTLVLKAVYGKSLEDKQKLLKGLVQSITLKKALIDKAKIINFYAVKRKITDNYPESEVISREELVSLERPF